MYPTVTVKGFSGLMIVVFLVVSEAKGFIFEDDGGTDFCTRGVNLQQNRITKRQLEESCNVVQNPIRQKIVLKEGRIFQNELYGQSRDARQTRINPGRRSLGRIRSDEAEKFIRREGNLNLESRVDNRAIRSFNRHTTRSSDFHQRRDVRTAGRISDIRVRRNNVQADRYDRNRADTRRSVATQSEIFEGNGHSMNVDFHLGRRERRNSDTRSERVTRVTSMRKSSSYERERSRLSRGIQSQRENSIDARSENLLTSRRNAERVPNRRLSNTDKETSPSSIGILDNNKIGRSIRATVQSEVLNRDMRRSHQPESELGISIFTPKRSLNENNSRRSVQEPRRGGYSIPRIYSSSRSGYPEENSQRSTQERRRNVEITPEGRKARDSSRSEVNRRSSDRLREFGNDRRQRQNFELRKRETNTENRDRITSRSSQIRSISSRRDAEERRSSVQTIREEMERSQRKRGGGIRISSSPNSREPSMRDLRIVSQESFSSRKEDAFKNLETLERTSGTPRFQRILSKEMRQNEQKGRLVDKTTGRNNRSLRVTDNFGKIRSIRKQQSSVDNYRRSDAGKAAVRTHRVVETTPEEKRTRDPSRSEANRRSSERSPEFGNERRQRENSELRKRETNTENRFRVDSRSSQTRSISSRRDAEERGKSVRIIREEMEISHRKRGGGIRISSSPNSREPSMRDLRIVSQESFSSRKSEAFKNLESLERTSGRPRFQRVLSKEMRQNEEKGRLVEANRRSSERSPEFGYERRQRENSELRKSETNTENRYRVDSRSSQTRSISSRRDTEERRSSVHTRKGEIVRSQRNRGGEIRIPSSPTNSRETSMRDLRIASQESLNLRRINKPEKRTNIFSERETEKDETGQRFNRKNYRNDRVSEIRRYASTSFSSRKSDSLKNLESLKKASRAPRFRRVSSRGMGQIEEKLRFIARTTRRDNRGLRKTNNLEGIRSIRKQQYAVENRRITAVRSHKVIASRDLSRAYRDTMSLSDIQSKRNIPSVLSVSIPSLNSRINKDEYGRTEKISLESPGDEAFGNWQGSFQLTLASILVGQLVFSSSSNSKRRCLLGNWMSKVQIF